MKALRSRGSGASPWVVLAFFLVPCILFIWCLNFSVVRRLPTQNSGSSVLQESRQRGQRVTASTSAIRSMTMEQLRIEADKILAVSDVTCDYKRGEPGDKQLFYNRIGKAGSSTLSKLVQQTINRRDQVFANFELAGTTRGSDEFMTRQGELELIQKIVGNPKMNWMGSARSIFVYHTFFLNFTRYGVPSPIYMNLMRDPAQRYASQYNYWKTLPDIGKLTREHGASMEVCLKGQYMGCPPLNYQTSYLCGHEPDCHDPPNDASFLQAVRHVVQEYALVGTLEQFDDFKEQFLTMFPEWVDRKHQQAWHRQTRAANVNHKNQKNRTEEELAPIRQANMYDQLLYEIVEKISAQRSALCKQKLENVAATK